MKWLPIVIFLGLCLFLWRGLSLDPHHLPSVQIGKALPEFQLPLLDAPESRLTPQHFKNKVVLLNVWASWCDACSEEQVFLMELAGKGVPVYGINYKDNSGQAKQWLEQWGNPYRLIASDPEGRVAMDLGVYGTPETFVVDKQGMIRYRHAGILTEKVWKKTIQPLIKELDR